MLLQTHKHDCNKYTNKGVSLFFKKYLKQKNIDDIFPNKGFSIIRLKSLKNFSIL